MNWVHISKIYGKSFRSLSEPFDIQFPESGMTLIRGLNKDTGDSSASGKSSIVLAISYLFGGCPFPRTELQSWDTDVPILVGGVLETPTGNVVVERSDKGLKVEAAGEVLNGKAAEAKLDTIFGMDAKTRALTTYRGQGQDGLFLSMSDAEKKEFLTETLGLEIYEKVSAEAAQKSKLLKDVVLGLKGRLDAAEENCNNLETIPDIEKLKKLEEALKTGITEYGKVVKYSESKKTEMVQEMEDVKKTISIAFENKFDRIKSEISATLGTGPEVSGLESGLTGLKSELAILSAQEKTEFQEFHKEKTRLQSIIDAGSRAKKKAVELKASIAELKAKEAKILELICPTCKQQWSDGTDELAKILDLVITLKKQGKECMAAVEAGNAATQLLGSLPPPVGLTAGKEQEIQSVESQVRTIRDQHKAIVSSEIAKLREEERITRQDLNQQLLQYSAQYLEGISQINEQIEECNREIGTMMSDQNVARFQINSVESSITRNQKTKSVRDGLSLEYSKALAGMEAESDFSDLVGRTGFLGVIFDEILDEISAATNDILSKVANVRHLTFGFVSEKESASGNSQKRICPVVNCGGKTVDFRSGLSGGMQSAVKLAVDLAVGEVISKRRGSYPGWLVLDESFDGLGRVSKESCLEMLGSYAGDRLVLVIDHATEFQGLFNQTIDVVSVEGKSSVVS